MIEKFSHKNLTVLGQPQALFEVESLMHVQVAFLTQYTVCMQRLRTLVDVDFVPTLMMLR